MVLEYVVAHDGQSLGGIGRFRQNCVPEILTVQRRRKVNRAVDGGTCGTMTVPGATKSDDEKYALCPSTTAFMRKILSKSSSTRGGHVAESARMGTCGTSWRSTVSFL